MISCLDMAFCGCLDYSTRPAKPVEDGCRIVERSSDDVDSMSICTTHKRVVEIDA